MVSIQERLILWERCSRLRRIDTNALTFRRLRLPPGDGMLSPYSGWTRAHWEGMADHLLDAVVPHAVPGYAQYRLPGRPSGSGLSSDGLEGYARTFMLAAFRIAGAGGAVPSQLLER